MTGTLIVLAILISYFATGTVVGAKATVMYGDRSESSSPNRNRPASSRYQSDSEFGGVITGLFWPIGVWILLGARLLDLELKRAKRREAALRDREKAVAERESLLVAARQELDAL